MHRRGSLPSKKRGSPNGHTPMKRLISNKGLPNLNFIVSISNSEINIYIKPGRLLLMFLPPLSTFLLSYLMFNVRNVFINFIEALARHSDFRGL